MTVKSSSLMAIAILVLIAGCHSGNNQGAQNGGNAQPTKLIIKDLTKPTHTGKDAFEYTAAKGDQVSVTYKGWLDDGSVFDTNNPATVDDPRKSVPYAFTLGAGTVVKGWDEGLVGMQVGQTRELTIPSSLGYGADGRPPKIPANATLHFDIELQGIVKKGEEGVYDSKDIKVGKGASVVSGDVVTLGFTGKLVNGKEVMNSVQSGPLTFQAGTGKVDSVNKLAAIGLETAVIGMKVGGVRQITLPPAIGPGSQASQSGIPANSIIIMEVTLQSIKPASALKN